MNPSQLQNHFDAFYEDFWCEMCKYGLIEEVVVCDNNNDRKSQVLSSTLRYDRVLMPPVRSHRKCLRAVQVRGRRPDSLRRT
jgi:hypothetical protein